jgi:hypothetical protein
MLNKNTIIEWIPYNQFNEIKKTGNNNSSAIWKDGPLCYYSSMDSTRDSNKKAVLKCLHDSQNTIECLLDEV